MDLNPQTIRLAAFQAELDEPVGILAYEETIRILTEQVERRNQIIRELMAWIDSEFRLDTYLPGSPGKELWDRAREATR